MKKALAFTTLLTTLFLPVTFSVAHDVSAHEELAPLPKPTDIDQIDCSEQLIERWESGKQAV